ncbi:receptor-like serine/threonine-protein kinase SD1-8 isoform X2 [Magnolia sinica]|uniref:receptor-like serine/threonine-protein kinase SD1-8 isoform X2 n=1 Tax=Magnolia sinica TaxID=86752 RepID=UPI00265A066B|nr:receptor-like serine/threonine-protein kinase SD1-8 isoform X2 [Magnolia sinica]
MMIRKSGKLFILLSFFIFYCLCIRFSHAVDTITQDQPLHDGNTLISAGEVFELGFFTPGKSKNRYVGIWYKKVKNRTVVWVANRKNPVLHSSGVLTINSTNGNLMISDKNGSNFMVTNDSATNQTTAQLLDSGNLILIEGNSTNHEGRVIWQSFDYPTDTYLPGMKLGVNRTSRRKWLLTSWTSEDDPAPGNFTNGIDSDGLAQLFTWRGRQKYWTSGTWNGEIFSLLPEMRTYPIFNYSYVSNEDGTYFIYSLYDKTTISISVIDVSGQMKQMTWLESSLSWYPFWSQPGVACDFYAACGAYGICDGSTSLCKCLPGFEPYSGRDWHAGDKSNRCMRRIQLKCGNEDGFSRLNGMIFSAHARVLKNSSLSLEECESECRRNCSCIAYASAHDNRTGCSFWDGELMNLRKISVNVPDLYVRLAASELDPPTDSRQQATRNGKKKRQQVIIAVTITISILLFGSVTCYFCRRNLKPKGNQERSQEVLLHELRNNGSDDRESINANMLREGRRKGLELPLFSFATVVAATDNFSPTNKLGQGGFGPVYKGMLHEGPEIAVKRLSRSSGQGLEEFKNEIILIAKLQHMNLVRILGCCIEGEEKILLYEYMPNKSLDSFLFDPTKGKLLDWGKRVHIINGIAQGLLYLHKYSRLRVIHRDLKASNILLDGEMNPKISDFGMARIFGRNESEANTNRVVGTYGYMSPEYAMEGLFSEKSDVFSFGVLLLEIVSGKKNTSFYHSDRSLNLLGYAWELWKDGRVSELMDPMLGDPTSSCCDILRFIQMGLLCVQESAKDRPTMSDVVSMLSNEMATLAANPKQPAFFLGRRGLEENSSKNRTENCSNNDLTISEIEAR